MTTPLRAMLLLAVATAASAATVFNSVSSHSSGSSHNGLSTRGGFGRRGTSGGTAYASRTSFNNQPGTYTSYTSGTGQNSFGYGSSLGTRGAFPSIPPIQVPRLRPINFSIPQVRIPQQYGTGGSFGFYSGGTSSRFGGRPTVNYGSYPVAGSGFDTNDYFNRLMNNINQAFAAGAGR